MISGNTQEATKRNHQTNHQRSDANPENNQTYNEITHNNIKYTNINIDIIKIHAAYIKYIQI